MVVNNLDNSVTSVHVNFGLYNAKKFDDINKPSQFPGKSLIFSYSKKAKIIQTVPSNRASYIQSILDQELEIEHTENRSKNNKRKETFLRINTVAAKAHTQHKASQSAQWSVVGLINLVYQPHSHRQTGPSGYSRLTSPGNTALVTSGH